MKPAKIIFILLISFALPFFAFAQGLVPCGGPNKPCSVACFYVLIDNIINFLLLLAIPLAATAMMAAGIMFLLGGSEKTISRGREIFRYTLIGLFIAFAAWLIIDLIMGNLLEKNGTYWPWSRFPTGC